LITNKIPTQAGSIWLATPRLWLAFPPLMHLILASLGLALPKMDTLAGAGGGVPFRLQLSGDKLLSMIFL
jgi:hypothetical protein